MDLKDRAALIVSFDTRELRDRCEKLDRTEAWLGSARAAALVEVVTSLEAASNVAEFLDLFGSDARLRGDDSLEIALDPRCRALFAAVGTKFFRGAGGRIEWTSVDRIKLMTIEIDA